MENRRILFFLHIDQCAQYLCSHLVHLIDRKTKVSSCVVLQVFTFQQLHQRIEQALCGAVIELKLHDVVMVERFQCFKLVDGIVNRGITLKNLDGKILFLHIVPHLENSAKTTTSKDFMQGHGWRDLYTWFHVLQVSNITARASRTSIGGCMCRLLLLIFHCLFDEADELVSLLPPLVWVCHNRVFYNLVHPLWKVF